MNVYIHITKKAALNNSNVLFFEKLEEISPKKYFFMIGNVNSKLKIKKRNINDQFLRHLSLDHPTHLFDIHIFRVTFSISLR